MRLDPRRLAARRPPLLGAVALLGGVLALSSACGGGESGSDGWDAATLGRVSQAQPFTASLINAQVGAGPARLGFGLFDRDGGLVHDAAGALRLVTLEGDKPTEAGRFDLTRVALEETETHTHDGKTETHTDPVATVYVANVDLARGEWWGAELAVRTADKEHTLRTRFFVQEKTSEPAIGAAVPRSTQRVLRDVRDIAEIDSSNPPRPALHELTVAEAIASGKPSLVAFATPAFCRTRFCGPVVDSVVAPLAERYAGRVLFLHIEPYDLAQARQGRLVAIPELEQWGLTTEPYLFLVDGSGKVAAKFEGITSAEEVEAALRRLLGN